MSYKNIFGITKKAKFSKYIEYSAKIFITQKSVSTDEAPNEKDAMTSRCLDRKEVRCATWQMHSTGPAWPVETQDIFF